MVAARRQDVGDMGKISVLWWFPPDGSYAGDDLHVWLSLVVAARRQDAGDDMGKNGYLWWLPPDGKMQVTIWA